MEAPLYLGDLILHKPGWMLGVLSPGCVPRLHRQARASGAPSDWGVPGTGVTMPLPSRANAGAQTWVHVQGQSRPEGHSGSEGRVCRNATFQLIAKTEHRKDASLHI